MATTKFEITMTVEVVDVGNVQASSGALHTSVIKAVEGISTGDVIKVIKAHTSQLTFPKGLVQQLAKLEAKLKSK